MAGLFYWQLCANLENHPANPRYYQVFKQDRGVILDRHGVVLAASLLEDDAYSRQYATQSLCHVLGYFHPRYGLTGLERLYHEELLRGRTLITTLDFQLQEAAAEALHGKKGAIVALNPKTGAILALVSSPGIDGNALDENWSDYLSDLRSPFLNRATHGLYPPGSVVKPIVYGAALEAQLVTPNQVWSDHGSFLFQDRTIKNQGQKAHGEINTEQALALSSNVVFTQIAVSLEENLLKALASFGLGREVPFELRNVSGFLPTSLRSEYDAAQLGMGQGELLVTPLQMALAVATIANRGMMMRPYLVQELRGGLKMREIRRPQIIGEVLTEHVAVLVREAMVLAAKEGTAQTSLSGVLDYAAKTGTAQMNQGLDHSWFVGFAPSREPQIAVAVLVEHGGAGSRAAAPIGAMLMRKALEIVE